MQFNRKNLTDEVLTDMYHQLLLPRMIEEKMLVLLRQGKISKWFSGIGQEAISVGVTMALQQDEWIMPLHRNLGVLLDIYLGDPNAALTQFEQYKQLSGEDKPVSGWIADVRRRAAPKAPAASPPPTAAPAAPSVPTAPTADDKGGAP